MKKILTILLVLFTVCSFAQDREKHMERIKALRVAFISDRLDLSPEEAQKFWPVFNQFDERQADLHKQKRQLMHKLRPENTTNLSEKETAALMEQDENLETDMQNNRKRLAKELQGIIPNQKILMLKQLDIEFKEKLLKQMKNRRERR